MMYVISAFFVFSCMAIIYAVTEPYLLRVRQYEIEVNKPLFKGKRLLFISDIHASEIVSARFVEKLVKKANAMKPDIIIFGGDYVSHHERYIEPVFKLLKNLKAVYGLYGVIGNHDVDVNKEQVLKEMKKAGIQSLDNASCRVRIGNDSIKIGGVGDYLRDKQNIDNTLFDVTDDDFVILVSHNPDYAEEVRMKNIKLILSGHTHGGQVTFFGLFAPVIPSRYGQKFRTGLKNCGRAKVIISNGVGEVGMPIRFFARPELVEIKLI